MWARSYCDELLDEAKADGAKFDLMVADADAGVRETVLKHNISLARCANHGGKNAGNAGIKIGIGIAKKVQAAFGAKTEECGTDQKKWKLQVYPRSSITTSTSISSLNHRYHCAGLHL